MQSGTSELDATSPSKLVSPTPTRAVLHNDVGAYSHLVAELVGSIAKVDVLEIEEIPLVESQRFLIKTNSDARSGDPG
jgi:hypothetical protein